MITPLSIDDVDAASDVEIIAAYVEDGESEATARAYLTILRGASPADAIVD